MLIYCHAGGSFEIVFITTLHVKMEQECWIFFYVLDCDIFRIIPQTGSRSWVTKCKTLDIYGSLFRYSLVQLG